MPIISAEPIDSQIYRVSLMVYQGIIENIVVSPDGLYNIYYVKSGQILNNTGRILNMVQDRANPNQSYILFDSSKDSTNRRERIMFYQIQNIVDITPNDAYNIALKHGFVGTVDDWLNSLRGDPGKTAYELAVDAGFAGDEKEWFESLRGNPGLSAYDVAVKNGYKGSEAQWLKSLRGPTGDSAYEIAVKHGFEGTEEEWINSLGDTTGVQKNLNILKDKVEDVEEHLKWVSSMN